MALMVLPPFLQSFALLRAKRSFDPRDKTWVLKKMRLWKMVHLHLEPTNCQAQRQQKMKNLVSQDYLLEQLVFVLSEETLALEPRNRKWFLEPGFEQQFLVFVVVWALSHLP